MSATDTGSSSVLAPGTKVPPFALSTEAGESFSEDDLQGKTTVFVFYPFAFSPVCTDQLQVYEQSLDEITANDTVIYGVSCDSSWAQKAFREKLGVSIPQLSDFEPKGVASGASLDRRAGRRRLRDVERRVEPARRAILAEW